MTATPAQQLNEQSLSARATLPVVMIAIAFAAVHFAFHGRYGYHRDELQTIIDARHLAWGYVPYPPVTPFLGHVSAAIFGESVRAIRIFPAIAQTIAIFLTAGIARMLGGGRFAQTIAAAAAAISPVAAASASLYQYVAFDYLWWVTIAYLVARIARTGDHRLWLAVGAVVGLGMETKYTMGFFVLGVLGGMLLTPLRASFRSKWLWIGIALSVVLFLPNVIWEWRHHWITFDFLQHIHARDVRIGRAQGFLPEQLYIGANTFTIPLWLAGLAFYFRSEAGRRFRALGWMWVIPLVLFLLAKGRAYYVAGAYAGLFAGGAVFVERWRSSRAPRAQTTLAVATALLLIVGFATVAPLTIPIAPVNSPMWKFANKLNGDFRDELGWDELTQEVARIYNSLPPEERAHTGIFANNYGEAGAIEVLGPKYGLPTPLSGTNTYWLRGYPEPPPQTLIVLGDDLEGANRVGTCEIAGHSWNKYNVLNEETEDHPDILVCRNLRIPWPKLWAAVRAFG